MSDQVSVFSGINKFPVGVSSWETAINNIKSEKYRKSIELIRKPGADIRSLKSKLPSVTFSGTFSERKIDGLIETTGFIIPDLDHLENVESVFQWLTQDENVWFVFRSPSGNGLKCGIRSDGINSDKDHKALFDAVSRYFRSVYNLTLDPACKDISRLTFLSSDSAMFINPNPFMFEIQQWVREEQPRYTPMHPPEGVGPKKYGIKVLESSCQKIAESVPGQMHSTRLQMAILIGGYIASGMIDEGYALSEIERAVVASNVKNFDAAMKTVRDGIGYGKANPIILPEINTKRKKEPEYYVDMDECFPPDDGDVSAMSAMSAMSDGVSNVRDCQHLSAFVSKCQQGVSNVSSDDQDSEPQKPYNLAAHIKEWIENSTGSFTVEQIDREFCLTTRADKNNRSRVVSRLKKNNIIIKDKRIAGKYHILDKNLELIDLDNITESFFEIELPFGLSELITLPQKSIVIIAGSSNAGKTALILNILALNLTQSYKKYYLMSEMGAGEFARRLKNFPDIPMSQWKNICAAERSYDFNSVIEHHNKDGLTCIDFLEEVDGEYYRIPTDIRNIYEALGEGVAIIAIQKRTDQEYARGGQATAEKARLYLSVDLVAVRGTSIVCALKVVKAKQFVNRNIQNHELYLEIHSGSQMRRLTDWMRSEPGLREKMRAAFEQPNIEKYLNKVNSYVHQFKLKSGKVVGVNQDTIEKWKMSYQNIDVEKECERLSKNSFNNPFLGDGWFFQVSGILKGKDEKAYEIQEGVPF